MTDTHNQSTTDFNEDWLEPGAWLMVDVPTIHALLREVQRLRLCLSDEQHEVAELRLIRAEFAKRNAVLFARCQQIDAYAEQRKLALERARGCIKGLLARTPVRDVAETLAEIDAALATNPRERGAESIDATGKEGQ